MAEPITLHDIKNIIHAIAINYVNLTKPATGIYLMLTNSVLITLYDNLLNFIVTILTKEVRYTGIGEWESVSNVAL